MVDWKPLMGTLPPISETQWQQSFEKYQQFPEYREINTGMTLHEYKKIFFWEYFHRLWGRLMGIVFIVPFLVFWKKGYLPKPWFQRFIWILIGGGLVGGLGWFMVVSGLKDRPAVSHFRLAIHLTAALLLLSYIYFQSLLIKFQPLKKNVLNILKWPKWIITLVLIQIVYGAFVAGLHAGLIYNTFPLMGDSFISENAFSLTPFWENLINHKDGVQFIHRTIAWILFFMVLSLGYFSLNQGSKNRNSSIKFAMVMIVIQFLLGVVTLLMRVPVTLGVMHQIGAIILLLSLIRIQFFNRYSVI
jgi:cytochrome c oxidase assembly protein subunit 15